MDRRREPRVEANQPVFISVLELLPHLSARLEGRAIDLSGRGMRIALGTHIPPGSALKIEMGDSILLGEISYCNPKDNAYVAGVQLDQILRDSASSLRESATTSGDNLTEPRP